MRKTLTRLTLGAAAAVLASAATPRDASAAIYYQWGCIAFDASGCLVLQYCEVNTTSGSWWCYDTAGGYQEGRVGASSGLVADATKTMPFEPRRKLALPRLLTSSGDVA